VIGFLAAAVLATSGGQENELNALPPAGRQALLDLLFVATISPRDLRSLRGPESPKGLLKTAHERPIAFAAEVPSRLARLSETPGNSVLTIVREQVEMLAAPSALAPSGTPVDLPEELPSALRDPIRSLIQCVVRANDEIQAAMGTLTAEERRALIEGLPRNLAPANALPLSFVRGTVRPPAELNVLLAKLDLRRIRNAGEWLHREADRLIRGMRSLAPASFQSKLKFTAGGLKVTVAGFADDVHEETDSVLTLDFGGRDRYSGRHGAGIGYASIFADFAGNDIYELPDASLGVGILGVGLAYDLGGRDHIDGSSLCMGAGIAGVGFFQAGQPTAPSANGSSFTSTAFSQGFGMAGVGVMSSFGGDADFRLRYLGQGAGIEGGVGWFGRKGGRDGVHATGLPPSLEGVGVLRTRAQGFGQTGGVGVFMTQSEATLGWAGSESQGIGIDEGIGMFVSAGGPMSVFCGGHGQGSGERRGVGVLWSQSGTDEYRCGEAGAGQGFGIDGGIGVLMDLAGSDTYISHGGQSGSASLAGIGMLFDFEGDDRFLEAGRLIPGSSDSTGIGFRLDVTGASSETVGFPGPRFDVGRLDRMVGQIEGRQNTTPLDEPNLSAAIAPNTREKVAAAVRVASGLEPFSNRTQRAQAHKDLAAGPDVVLDWILNGSPELERSEWEAVGAALRAAPTDIRRACADAIASPDLSRARRAMWLAAYAEFPEAVVAAKGALERDELAEAACLLLSNLNERSAINDLLPRCASPDAAIRRAAAAALATLGGPEAAPTLQALLGDIDPIVRRYAIAGRAGIRPPNLGSLQAVLQSGEEFSVRGAIAVLGQIGSAEAMQLIGPLLSDPRAGVRIEALMALNGRVPPPFRSLVDACRTDDDRRVRAVAIWVNPGTSGLVRNAESG